METAPSNVNKIDLTWLSLLTVIGGGLSVLLATTLFDLSIFFSGILCVALIAIGRREGYLVGLYNSLSYSILAYGNGLFGEVYLNLLFFVPTGIIGYLMWKRNTTQSKTVSMRQLAWHQRALIATICIIGTVILGFCLGLNKNQNTPFIDAATNVLSITATFLMMWRYKEQWLLYIVLNIVTIFMWSLRFLAGGEAGDLMILMWSLFLINALFGYWRWHVGANRQAQTNTMTNASQSTGDPSCDVV